jgi:hypothetical protein
LEAQRELNSVSAALKELAAQTRHLAKRALELAETTDEPTRLRLERYASDLEDEALRLEQATIH